MLSVILLSKGLSYAEISFIQSMYMLGALVFEFPSGILSDMFSEKKMYILSLILILISYAMVFIYADIVHLAIAWTIYGISAAAMTGTLDTFFVKELKRNNEDIKKFMADNNYSLLLSGLIGGSVGALFYNVIGMNIYLMAIGIFIISILFIILGIQSPQVVKDRERVYGLKEVGRSLLAELKSIDFSLLFIVVVISYGSLQLFFQFWQLIFLDKAIPSTSFFIIYPAFQVCSLISNLIFKKTVHKAIFNYFYLVLSTLFFVFGVLTHNGFTAVACFFVFYIIFGIYQNQINYELNERSNHKTLSSLVSFVGTISTLIGMLVLWSVSFFLQHYPLELVLAWILSLLAFVSILVLIMRQRTSKVPVSDTK